MKKSIQSIIDADAGSGRDDNGENARAIGTWIRSILHKITRYRAKHQHYLNEAATTIPPALPRDIVMNNVLPFLELPSYTFEEEEEEQYCFDLFDDGGEDY